MVQGRVPALPSQDLLLHPAGLVGLPSAAWPPAHPNGLLWTQNCWEHPPKASSSPNSSPTTPGYPNVVIVAAGSLSFPVQAQAEDGRQRGVTRVQDYGSLELG